MNRFKLLYEHELKQAGYKPGAAERSGQWVKEVHNFHTSGQLLIGNGEVKRFWVAVGIPAFEKRPDIAEPFLFEHEKRNPSPHGPVIAKIELTTFECPYTLTHTITTSEEMLSELGKQLAMAERQFCLRLLNPIYEPATKK